MELTYALAPKNNEIKSCSDLRVCNDIKYLTRKVHRKLKKKKKVITLHKDAVSQPDLQCRKLYTINHPVFPENTWAQKTKSGAGHLWRFKET